MSLWSSELLGGYIARYLRLCSLHPTHILSLPTCDIYKLKPSLPRPDI